MVAKPPYSQRIAIHCPLCEQSVVDPPFPANKCEYARCSVCDLVFILPHYRLALEEEYANYLQHENDPQDERYRAFLRRLTDAITPYLPLGAKGLDYGAGPGPTISILLGEQGYDVRNYDPFFQPDEDALRDRYDFIVCSETAEHFYSPAREFARLDEMLKPGGLLGIMTGILYETIDFAKWRYAREEAHVSFYSEKTLDWIAGRFGWRVSAPRENVALFFKPPFDVHDAN